MKTQSFTHSEGREWAAASVSIFLVWILCILFLQFNSIVFTSQSLASFYFTVQALFVSIGLYSVYLLFQGYRFRKGRATLSRKDGHSIFNSIKATLELNEVNLFEDDCAFAPAFGFWTPIGRLQFEEGEVEIKEIWFNRFFFRTQIAVRGALSLDNTIFNSIKDTNFSADLDR